MYNLQKACEIQTLCNLNHIQLIPQNILNDFPNQLNTFTDMSPNVIWEALVRTLDESYKL
jgi:hypothetical protein